MHCVAWSTCYGLLKAARSRGAAAGSSCTPSSTAGTLRRRARSGYLEELERFLRETGAGRIATVIGRYYAMDRDKRWDRVKQAYDAMVRGVGRRRPRARWRRCAPRYAEKVTDEFVPPTVIVDGDGTPVAHASATATR